MCAPEAASVDAVKEIPEVDRGRFEVLRCDELLSLAPWRSGLRGPQCGTASGEPEPANPQLPAELSPSREAAIRSLVLPFPKRAEPVVVEAFELGGLGARPGYGFPPFRPPVARA